MANERECPTCGGMPMGTGCYHICPNSVYFYSAEQERADEPHYGDDDNRERYAATAEPTQYYADDDDVHDSFRPNDDGSVTYISPTGGEHTYDPDQAFPRGASDDDVSF